MDLTAQFASDRDAEVDGVWFVVGGPNERLKVARFDNHVYAKALRDLTREKEVALDLGAIPDEEQNSILAEAYARGLLKDWEGMEYNGKPIKYTYENAKMVMEEYPDFRRLVSKLSDKVDAFRTAKEKGAKKSYASPSSSTSESDETS
jgi:hypothetical protein